jgi:hypothetical protein
VIKGISGLSLYKHKLKIPQKVIFDKYWLPAYDSLMATAMQLEDDALLQELAESFNLNSELLAV